MYMHAYEKGLGMTITKPPQENKVAKTAIFETETMMLQSLRMIAAPNPEDDLTDDELTALVKKPGQSAVLVKNLIEYIKKI